MNIDLTEIRTIDGDRRTGFEEFVCQIARQTPSIPAEAVFERFRGQGGDGGVECVFQFPNGDEWGWQSKYFFSLDKSQLDRSVETMLKIHPRLKRYFIAIPFDLTGPTGRKGKSDSEKFGEYKVEWQGKAKALGREIEFNLVDRSTLISELTRIDVSGGRSRFWFELEKFGLDWVKKHIEDAIATVGPRYTPQLSIKTIIAEVFEAFGRTTIWRENLHSKVQQIEKKIEAWEDCLHRGDWNGAQDFPERARESGESLLKKLQEIKAIIVESQNYGLNEGQISGLSSMISEAHKETHRCRSITKEEIEAKHGKGKADSVGFKQFMAEYEGSFPTRHYDTAREILTLLQELTEWLDGAMPRLPLFPSFLLTGPAGIGKTHTICDVALDRLQRGLASIVLLGEQFANEEPWTQINKLLGLSGSLSRDQLLDILSALGESTGYPTIIFIDAINETVPRDFWMKNLASFLTQTNRYQWLKVCVSCRSSYLEDTIPTHLQIIEVEHKGFEGVEFEACFEFLTFYGIEPPSSPLLQPEYSNPLFLKLVCEALRDTGQTKIPSGIQGFGAMSRFLFEAKNTKLATVLDYNKRENRVASAMELLIGEMANKNSAWLEWSAAKKLTEDKWPSNEWSKSFFNHLLRENLIKEDRVYDSDSNAVVPAISVAFERLGDHILASKYLATIPDVDKLKGAFGNDGELHCLVSDSSAIHRYSNLLEALAIQIPEKYHIEIDRLMPVSDESQTLIIGSVEWRDPKSITEEAQSLFRSLIMDGDRRQLHQVFEALLSITAIEDHPLNAFWLHDTLASIQLNKRDGKLVPFLHFAYGKQKSVDRLIRWGLRTDLSSLSKTTVELWLTTLCWFTASSDRRVRDYTTKAMVRIGEVAPEVWSKVINRFSCIDDEYVVERCLAAAYGTLLRANDRDASENIATVVFDKFFRNGLKYVNSVIIDYARLIIEYAKYIGVGKSIDFTKCIPPYAGNQIIEWPDEKFVEGYKDTYWELPKLYHSCMGDDFQHYTVPSVIGIYNRDGVTVLNACRWIFKNVLDMGYGPDLEISEFDKYLLRKYGGGRSRPEWAERVGKKYQWISLYRLAARLAITFPERVDTMNATSKAKPLLTQDERNIDPSFVDKDSNASLKPRAWWSPVEYHHPDPRLLGDKEWIKEADFPDDIRMLVPNNDFLVLYCNFSWQRRDLESRDGYPMRNMWMHLRSLLIRNEDIKKAWKWIQGQNFMGDWMPKGFELHYGFFGEYPWAPPFRFIYEEPVWQDSRKGIPCNLVPTSNELNIHFSFDAYQTEAFNLTVPSHLFFSDLQLRWNARDGYVDKKGQKVFFDPSIYEGGPSALVVNRNFLFDFLKRHDLSLLWTLLSEKSIIPGHMNHGPGYTEYSCAYLLMQDGSISLGKPFLQTVIH